MSIQRWSIEDASEYYEDGTGDMVTYADHIASHVYDEAKERELFEAEFKKPDTAKFDGEEYRYIGQAGRPDMVLFLEFVGGWYGWKACAKSRARSAE